MNLIYAAVESLNVANVVLGWQRHISCSIRNCESWQEANPLIWPQLSMYNVIINSSLFGFPQTWHLPCVHPLKVGAEHSDRGWIQVLQRWTVWEKASIWVTFYKMVVLIVYLINAFFFLRCFTSNCIFASKIHVAHLSILWHFLANTPIKVWTWSKRNIEPLITFLKCSSDLFMTQHVGKRIEVVNCKVSLHIWWLWRMCKWP